MGSQGAAGPGPGGATLSDAEGLIEVEVRDCFRLGGIEGGRGSSPDDAARRGRARWRWARAGGKRYRRRMPSSRNRGGGSWTGVTSRRRLRPWMREWRKPGGVRRGDAAGGGMTPGAAGEGSWTTVGGLGARRLTKWDACGRFRLEWRAGGPSGNLTTPLRARRERCRSTSTRSGSGCATRWTWGCPATRERHCATSLSVWRNVIVAALLVTLAFLRSGERSQ
jgi:hypothetical protein